MRWCVAVAFVAGCVATGEEQCFEFEESGEMRCGAPFLDYDDCETDMTCSAYRETPTDGALSVWYQCDDGWASEGRGSDGAYEFTCRCYPSQCVGGGIEEETGDQSI